MKNGLRKWSVVGVVILVGTSFRVANLISGAEFVQLVSTVVVAFVGGNATEHFCGAFARNRPDNPDEGK
jgi:hypothetical protein